MITIKKLTLTLLAMGFMAQTTVYGVNEQNDLNAYFERKAALEKEQDQQIAGCNKKQEQYRRAEAEKESVEFLADLAKDTNVIVGPTGRVYLKESFCEKLPNYKTSKNYVPLVGVSQPYFTQKIAPAFALLRRLAKAVEKQIYPNQLSF